MQNKNKLEQIVEYIKKYKVEWQLSYLQPLEILLNHNQEIDSELLDEICKNIQNLIYSEQKDSLFGDNHFSDKLFVYNAFIFFVERSLNNGNERSYDFMLFPGITEDAGALEVFRKKGKNSSKHVFMMDLPENMIDNSSVLLIVLCHELAHYVGRNIRSRKFRLDKIYDICSRLIILGVKTSLMQLVEMNDGYIDFDCKAWEDVEKVLSKWIQLYYQREINDEFIKLTSVYSENEEDECKKYNEENMQHMFFIKPTIEESISDMLKYKGLVIFEQVITDCFMNLNYEKREQLLQQCFEKIMTKTHPNNSTYSLSSALGYVEYLLKEAYADLISILELELSPLQYMNCIVSQYPDENFNKCSIKVCARIALVVYSMCYVDSDSKLGYTWNDEELMQLLSHNTKEGKMLEYVYRFILSYFSESCYKSIEATRKLSDEVYLFLFDNVILIYIFEYLLECKVKFNTSSNMDLEAVRTFFNKGDCEKYMREYKEKVKGYCK